MIGIYAQQEVLYTSFQLGGRNCAQVDGFGGDRLGRLFCFVYSDSHIYYHKQENEDTCNIL